MKPRYLFLLTTVAAALFIFVGGCTKTNPSLCCISEVDCAAIGLPTGTACESGFTCAAHTCVAATCGLDVDCTDPVAPHCGDGLCRECAATGHCDQNQPACNLNTYACEACSANSDCGAFAAAPFCGTSGSCVACTKSEQCAAAQPVCGDDGNCRLCEHDQECASGACDANGTCVAPASVLYISPTGIDAGGCVQTQPCKTVQFVEAMTTPARFHIAFAPGMYNQPLGLRLKPILAYHGNGAQLAVTDAEFFPAVNIVGNKIFVSDFEISATTMSAFGGGSAGSELSLRHVNISKATIVSSMGTIKFTWVDSIATDFAGLQFQNSPTTVTMRRLRFVTPTATVLETTDAAIALENVIIVRPRGNVFNVKNTTGTIQFVTVADIEVSAGAPHFVCVQSPVTIKASIFWAPRQPIIITGGCNFSAQNIVGPEISATPTLNVSKADPLFIDLTAGNFRLQPTSPAIDQVTTGPTTDIEGNMRPRGVAFDLGAYEAN